MDEEQKELTREEVINILLGYGYNPFEIGPIADSIGKGEHVEI